MNTNLKFQDWINADIYEMSLIPELFVKSFVGPCHVKHVDMTAQTEPGPGYARMPLNVTLNDNTRSQKDSIAIMLVSHLGVVCWSRCL
jgi:hypothetical protein